MYGGSKVTKSKAAEEGEDGDGEIIGADEEENIDELKVGIKRGREEGEQQVDRRQLKRQKRALVHKYYSGNFYYKCCANVMY